MAHVNESEILDVEKKFTDSFAGKKSAGGDSVVSGAKGRSGNIEKAVSSVVGGDEGMWQICGCGWSKNARTFFLSFFMFTTITSAQVAGALIANSNALLEDCASMGLDAIGYLINLYAECKPASVRRRQRNNLISSGISHGMLIGITVYFLYGAVGTMKSGDYSGSDCTQDDNCTGCSDTEYKIPCEYIQDSCQWNQSGVLNGCDAPDDVNPYIVFGFALGGLLFDVVCLWPYFLYGCPCFKKKQDDGEEDKAGDAVRMNLFSALTHVLADLVRSTTTFGESILIWAFGINGDKCDCFATVIIGVTIILGMIKPMMDWFQNLAEFCAAEDDEETKDLLQDDEEESEQ